MHINPSQPRQCCSYKCRSVLKTKKIKVNCPICGKGFYGLPKEIEKGHDKYCSAKCNGVGLMRGKILNCTICGKPYYRSLSRIRKGNGSKCCSMKCLSIYALTKTKRINTSIEIAMEKILIKNNVSYIKQFPIENIAVVDFLLPGKIIIQCDGDYWHNLPGKKNKDLNQDIILGFKGYKICRFTETEIKKDINKCIQKILDEINGEKNYEHVCWH
jgi:very-short-patch-repair endonuclease